MITQAGVVLDTSVVVSHLRKRINIFAIADDSEVLFLPVFALGELYKGAEKANQSLRQYHLINALFERFRLLEPDVRTARRYAQVAATLERMGRPIPENDFWIAAAALETKMPLATQDAHFERVPGLTVLRW